MDEITDFINIAKELGFFEYVDEERMHLPIYARSTPLVNKSLSVDGGDDTLALFEVYKLTGVFYFKWFLRKGRVMTRVFDFSLFDFSLTNKDFQVTKENVKSLLLETLTLMKNSEYNNTEPTEREIYWWEDEIRQIQTWKKKIMEVK